MISAVGGNRQRLAAAGIYGYRTGRRDGPPGAGGFCNSVRSAACCRDFNCAYLCIINETGERDIDSTVCYIHRYHHIICCVRADCSVNVEVADYCLPVNVYAEDALAWGSKGDLG